MLTFRDRAIQAAFELALFTVGFAFLFCLAAPRQASADDPGCATNTCKTIKFYYSCAGQTGIALQTLSCSPCTTTTMKVVSGRCKNGTTATCVETSMDNPTATLDVMNVCDCQTGWDQAGGTVEATGTYSGSYMSTGITVAVCQAIIPS
jgi:hypothetical protein